LKAGGKEFKIALTFHDSLIFTAVIKTTHDLAYSSQLDEERSLINLV
jgi:hypothetical protein